MCCLKINHNILPEIVVRKNNHLISSYFLFFFNKSAPLPYLIIFVGVLIFLFLVFENIYIHIFKKPLYRHLGYYSKLPKYKVKQIENHFPFYNRLSSKNKKLFKHRVAGFLATKRFISEKDFIITGEMTVLIAATACKLSFGRKNYEYRLINTIVLYPDEFYNTLTNKKHKGEFNPKAQVLALSWADFIYGLQIDNDAINLGLHEFMHAMHLEATRGDDTDSAIFLKVFQKITNYFEDENKRNAMLQSNFFRKYAFTNKFEFIAVITEYFIETPQDFKAQFPNLYALVKKMLNFNFEDY